MRSVDRAIGILKGARDGYRVIKRLPGEKLEIRETDDDPEEYIVGPGPAGDYERFDHMEKSKAFEHFEWLKREYYS